LRSALLAAWVWQAGLAPAWAESDAGERSTSNLLTADPDLAIFTFVIFLLLLAVLYVLAWKPLLRGLDQRERAMAEMVNGAKRRNDEAARKLEEYQRKLAEAAVEAQAIVEQARRDADAAAEKLLAQARAQARQERERALSDIASAQQLALRQIAEHSANVAFTLARRLIRKELQPEDHAALIRETLEQLPSEN
jgi:F-type H+-transporting ATPase subunit b